MGKRDRQLGRIRASVLAPIVAALDLGKSDTDAVLGTHGLSRSQLRDPYATVPLHRYVAFLEAAAELIGDPSFGLRLGTTLRPIDLGPAGLLFAVAPTLRQGLERFGRYLATIQSATEARVHQDGDYAAWIYRIEDPTIWPRTQDSELSVAVMCTLIRSRLGDRWAPLEVHFEHDMPARPAVARDVFRAPVRFNQPVTQVLMARADLDRPLHPAMSEVTPALERHAQDLLRHAAPPSTLSERVRAVVGARIGIEPVSVLDVAEAIGLSARSLQRGLANEGTTLRALVREHRSQMAELRLTSGTAQHALIAQAMGYSDATVFWRAFKHWKGVAPRAFRSARRALAGMDDDGSAGEASLPLTNVAECQEHR